MNEQTLLQKADIALSDLTSGGLLNPDQANRFFRKLIDQPTIVGQVRIVPMKSPNMEINKVGFQNRILRAATQGSISTPELGEVGSRALSRSDRASPQTSKVTLSAKEVIAEINIPYEVLEDNIEQSEFQQTILQLMAERVALDLEELVVLGDTSNGSDTYLALQDGVLKQTVSNLVNQNGQPISPELFGNMIEALPTKYHRLLGKYRFFTSIPKNIAYRMQVAQRQTSLGDAVLQGTVPVSVLGVQMEGAALMPASQAVLVLPSNIILGVHREMRMEYARDVRERVIIIVLTMRIAVKFEEEDMMVKAFNIA